MHRLKALIVQLLLRISARVPIPVLRTAGRVLGRCVCYLPRALSLRSTRAARINIALAYPRLSEEEQRVRLRETMCATGELLLEAGYCWLRPWPEVQRQIRQVHGAQHLQQARQAGGVLILAPHLGNWEVLGLHLGAVANVLSLYEPPKLSALDSLIRNARTRSGATLAPTSPAGLRQLLRVLHEGGVVAVLPDQVPKHAQAGRNIPFMGVTCATVTLVHNVLQRCNAQVVYAFALRVTNGFDVHYEPAEQGIYSANVSESLQSMNRSIESCVAQAPAQYQWAYKRFRTRPPVADDYYASV